MPARPTVPLSALLVSTVVSFVLGALFGAEVDVSLPAPTQLDGAVPVDRADHRSDQARGPDGRARDVRRHRRSARRTHGIIEQAPDDYLVPADALPAVGTEAPKLGRALLHRDEHGVVDGYRLSAIRHGSLPDTLGLRNGDIVHEVAGIPVTSMEDASSAWSALAGLDTFHVELTRQGQQRLLTYRRR